MDVQLGCNYQQMKPRDVVLSMFQKIDSQFDLVVIQSDKPLVMIRWVDMIIDMRYRLNTSYRSVEF